MKNYEKYSEQLKHLHFAEDCNNAYKKIKKTSCLEGGMCCRDCEFKSIEAFLKFMNEEYKEPIQLSYDEYVILKNLPSNWKYICRDGDGMVCLFEYKPNKGVSMWKFCGRRISFKVFEHLFQFIKWEDEEPYSIQQLIEDYEKEHEND